MRSILTIAILLCSCCIFAAEEAPKLPRDAQTIMDGYNKAVTKIQEDAAHKVSGEREKAYTLLDRASKEAAKKGDADAIVAIKAEMKKMLAEAQKEDDTDMLGVKNLPAEVVGKWAINYTNGATRIYDIAADGTVKFNGATLKIEASEDGKAYLIRNEAVGQIERVKLAKDKLLVEHWNPLTGYPKLAPTFTGTGDRMKDEPKK